jgi:hypothetical protein
VAARHLPPLRGRRANHRPLNLILDLRHACSSRNVWERSAWLAPAGVVQARSASKGGS